MITGHLRTGERAGIPSTVAAARDQRLPLKISGISFARSLRGLMVRHWPFLVVLTVGAGIRLASEVAYHPALFYPDSWEYLGMALQKPFVGFEVDRPSGYPFFVYLLTLDNRTLILLTGAQHLAGLVTAVMVYMIGLRLRLGRWISALVAALVALDGAWIALEQHIMTEPLFSLCIVGAVLAVIDKPSSRWRWALSGGLLATASLMRTGGVFLVPAWLAFALLRRVGWRAALAGGLALVVPLLAYCSLHAADGRGFGFTQSGGWFLYARVAPIARCTTSWPSTPELRSVCPTAKEQAEGWVPGDYLWDASSPANRVFTSMYIGDVAHKSAVLETFAHQALLRRPGPYLAMIWDDLVAVFNPSGGGWESSISFPAPGQTDWVDPVVKAEYQKHYNRRVDAPQSELRAYESVMHTPRWPLGVLTAAGLLSLGLAAISRRWRARAMPAETLLLVGMGFLLLLGTIATSDMDMRYVLPCVPFLALGGAKALATGISCTRRRVSRSQRPE